MTWSDAAILAGTLEFWRLAMGADLASDLALIAIGLAIGWRRGRLPLR